MSKPIPRGSNSAGRRKFRRAHGLTIEPISNRPPQKEIDARKGAKRIGKKAGVKVS